MVIKFVRLIQLRCLSWKNYFELSVKKACIDFCSPMKQTPNKMQRCFLEIPKETSGSKIY